ncbi:MAG: hypothetical protein ACK4F9_01295 [Brevinematia bacterium]
MDFKNTLIEILIVSSLIFVMVSLALTVYRASILLNRCFPGFFIYHTKVINIYDIPEWWEGRRANIPTSSILKKIDDQNISSTKDFWDFVLNKLDVEKDLKVEYEVNGEIFIKFVRAKEFKIKDFVAFVMFWQITGVLLIILGIVIYLGNKSIKGELWLLANILTGINFVTTPASSMLSDILIITLVERISFSLFPISIAWLFLYFPLVKFKKQTRIIIISITSSIGISFLVISLLGYTDIKEVVKFQEMYYFYPGIGGLFAVVMPIYDYFRVSRHKLYQFPKILLPLSIGALLFILIPSVFAILTTFFNISSYYIPLIVIGYPILVISTLMVNSLNVVREISIDLSIMVIISLLFSITFIIVLTTVTNVPIYVSFTVLGIIFILLSFFVFSLVRNRVSSRFIHTSSSTIFLTIIDNFRKISTIGKIISFINKDLAKILDFSFSKFVSYKLIPKNLRKNLYIANKHFFNRDEIDEFRENKIENFLRIIGNSKYIIVLKHNTRFFGLIALGKKITGDILTRNEQRSMDSIGKLLSSYMNLLADFIIEGKSKKFLYQKHKSVSNVLLNSLLKNSSISKEEFSVNSIVKGLDRPVIYKIKETEQGMFFCIVWILPESLHTLSLASLAKGMIEEYFFRNRINIYRLPREIRNLVASVTPIEVDVNIVCGLVKPNSVKMDVVNDGKTSIVLITRKNSIIPMPLHKRYFEFSKIKEGDTFLFITGEEIINQIQEIKEMNVGKIDPEKFFYNIPDKFILEIKFHKGSQ